MYLYKKDKYCSYDKDWIDHRASTEYEQIVCEVNGEFIIRMAAGFRK